MAAITSIPQLSAPVWVAFKRLEFHTQSGGMLDGLKFRKFDGTVRSEGTTSLPSLAALMVSVEQKAAPGGQESARSGGDKVRSNNPLSNELVLKLELAVDQKHGLVKMDPESTTTRKGLLDWAALVMDAIETDVYGRPDARLEQSLSEPVSFLFREPDLGTLSMHPIIEVILPMRMIARAERSYTFPVLPTQ